LALKAKILGTIGVILVLVVGSILACNWKAIVPAAVQTTTTGRTGSALMRIKVPINGCYLGASLERMPPVDVERVHEFEKMAGRRLAFLDLSYTDIGGKEGTIGFPEKDLSSLVRNSYLPAVRWFPLLSKSSDSVTIPTLQEVIDGRCDANIGIWAAASKSLQHQYILRLGWEMNTNSSAWGGAHNFGKDSNQTWNQADNLNRYYGDPSRPDGPERYVDAWRRVRRIFREQGATNVLFLWSPLYDNYPNEKWNEAENYYPGDDCVDLVGCSLYNEGYWEEEGGHGKWWRDFEDIFQKEPVKIYSGHPSKPFWIGEMGCSEEVLPNVRGNKPEWILKAYERIRTAYQRIKGVSWFSKYYPWERDWRVNSSPESLEAYRKAISDPYFLERVIFEAIGSAQMSTSYCSAVLIQVCALCEKTKCKWLVIPA